ncbi:MAG: 3-isopropylmalate dehydratase small subunit [Thermodesulfobacteriota bacterium]
MVFKGTVWKFGHNIDTDVIIPARYLNDSDPVSLAEHCMENANSGFSLKMKPGDLIAAGSNFGCGSSREHAPIALKAKGVSCIIAETFARIFYRNAFNTGLPILESRDAVMGIKEGDTIQVELETGRILNLDTGRSFQAAPVPEFMRQILKDGGLIPHIIRRGSG